MAGYVSPLWDPVAQRDIAARALHVATCSLCGLERPVGLMVPDGGDACTDVRWYCKDAKSCTQRWTSRLHEPPVAPSPGGAAAGTPAGEPADAPAEAPAGQHA